MSWVNQLLAAVELSARHEGPSVITVPREPMAGLARNAIKRLFPGRLGDITIEIAPAGELDGETVLWQGKPVPAENVAEMANGLNVALAREKQQ